MRALFRTEKEREALVQRLLSLPVGKHRYWVEVKVHRPKRSLPQNRLYWMWLRCIKDETGNDEKVLHEYFSQEFLPWSSGTVFGDYIDICKSTTELNTKEFTDYLERIKEKMLDQGIILPNPGDIGWDEFYAQYYEARR